MPESSGAVMLSCSLANLLLTEPTGLSDLLDMPTLDRRQLLATFVAATATASLTACSSSADNSAKAEKPDPQLTDFADEQSLVAAYDATLARHPDLASQLSPLRQQHTDHLAALANLVGKKVTATVAPTPETSAVATVVPSTVPNDKTAAIAALRKAEHSATAARTASCLTASKERAVVLASIAACEASHEVVLS